MQIVSDLKSRVISVKFHSKKNNLFIVRLENGYEYKVHADSVVKYKIKKNSYVYKEVINDALNMTEKQLIKHKIIVLLSYRQRSKHELIKLFLAKGFNLNNITDVINDLEEREYINDYKFATMYASHLIKEKKLGHYLVIQKLKHHKIDSQIIEEIVSKLYNDFPSLNTINEIIKKKKRFYGVSEKNKIRLTNYLKRKGFQIEDISLVIESKRHDF